MNLEKLTADVCSLARETGSFLRQECKKFSASAIEVKGDNNFVSYVDKLAEKLIVDRLRILLPESGFITEEGTAQSNNERYRWVIDPLDGTTNFIHGLYPFCVSIALMDGEEVIIGVIYEVGLDECFYAWSGSKAFCNGHEIHVSETSAVQDSLIATGFPYTDFDRLEPYLNSFEYLLKNTHGARRLGSAAVDLAYVANGRFEAFYEYSLHPWDVAAGALIVQQAGGKVSNFAGSGDYIFGKDFVATNAKIYDEFMKFVNLYFSML